MRRSKMEEVYNKLRPLRHKGIYRTYGYVIHSESLNQMVHSGQLPATVALLSGK